MIYPAGQRGTEISVQPKLPPVKALLCLRSQPVPRLVKYIPEPKGPVNIRRGRHKVAEGLSVLVHVSQHPHEHIPHMSAVSAVGSRSHANDIIQLPHLLSHINPVWVHVGHGYDTSRVVLLHQYGALT